MRMNVNLHLGPLLLVYLAVIVSLHVFKVI